MNITALLEFVRILNKNGLGAPVLVIIILAMMIVPLPAIFLDIFFTFNISLSLIVMLVVIYTLRPLDFAVFPTVLLVATMLRLALNIASTRVVLLEGHTGTAAAGSVIESFGEFVIGGNYAVGLVVFSILVIINFVVVTKGAGRVSEVSARFTLDAMPGKQMAIDADLNAGLITQAEAKQRRIEIASEADFYGSMDGASKFVRGDAIAGILILFINILGGFAIGVGQHDLPFNEALENYTLLTVGDGLVAQIPSLLLSTATAIIVTRVSTSQDMGEQVTIQMFRDPRALAVTSGIVGILGLIPGMPNIAFIMFSIVSGATAYFFYKHKQGELVQAEEEKRPEEPLVSPAELNWDDMKPVDIIGLEVGYRLIPLVDKNQGGQLMGRIKGVRRKLSQELGFLIQPVHIRDNLNLSPGGYRITILGVPEGEAEVYPEKELAINSGTVFGDLSGVPTKDPAFGMDALWIDPSQRDHAQTLGYTVVDSSTVIVTHLSKVLQDHASELLGYEETQQILNTLAQTSPKLVEDLVPKTLPLGTVVRVLQSLLQEKIPIRNMRTIAETLAEHAPNSQDADTLTAVVRIALRRMIVQQINGLVEELPVITLDSELEQLLLQSITSSGVGGIVLEPGLTERLHSVLLEIVQRQEMAGNPSVLLVAPQIRPWVARMFGYAISELHVLAYNEVPENKKIRIVANIGRELIAEKQQAVA